MNDEQSRFNYFICDLGDNIGNLEYNVNQSLDSSAPVILRIRINEQDKPFWKYSTPGHFLNVSGQTSGASNYYIVDPNRASAACDYYLMDKEKVFNAVNRNFAHHFYSAIPQFDNHK